MSETKILLTEKEMPTHWYNLQADLPHPLSPPLHPGTLQPLGPDDLAPLFPMSLIMQEMSQERWIEIPDQVRDLYALYRPSPLFRAHRLEAALDTPAKIYYKNEGWSPAGSHKPNTAIAQAYYNKEAGIKRLTTETGAGQWGSALSFACRMFGLDCTVYMVRVSYKQKPYRRLMMHVWGADVYASPSEQTEAGRQFLAKDPDHPGSLGLAISEAVEDAVKHDDAHYALGSVLNHVLLHQTVIGLEAKKQMEKAGDYPDYVIASCGGGSNLGGIAFPFAADKLTEGKQTRLIATEPAACPTLTRGEFCYDFGDTAATAPVVEMYTLGHTFIPASIHAGGLRYHGDSPLVSMLVHENLMEAQGYTQRAVFDAALQFARTEGMIPAPEAAHAIKGAIDAALECKESGEKKTILFNMSGHGHFDLGAYETYLSGELQDFVLPQEDIDKALALVPKV
jgi:tryptophan synthase beta chain